MVNSNRLKAWIRAVIFMCSILMIGVLFFPIWRIELSAPQYPEGLALQIFAGKLGGDVNIINGLNHYIGMKTLHANDFIEFTILPYFVIFFAVLILVTAVVNRRPLLYTTTALFIAFAIVSMVDFWWWEYKYGHDLNPDAAIQVPGMAYQPPLIGYKQLLNFSAFSIPDVGGWFFIIAGLFLFICVVIELRSKKLRWLHSNIQAAAVVCMLFFLASCQSGPQPIVPGKDACSYCKMTVSDPRFGGEIVTNKNKVYKFDDMHCFLAFIQEGKISKPDIKEMYVVNFSDNHDLIKANEHLLLFKTDALRSPMGGNIAAFDNSDSLAVLMKKYKKGLPLNWDELIK